MDTLTNGGGGPVHIEYIDLNGVVGVFVKLDATNVDENVLDTVQMALGHQLRLLVQANREGAPLEKESYVRSGDKMKKGRPVQCRYCEEVYHCRPDLATHQTKVHPTFPVRAGRRPRRPCPQCGKMVLNLSLHVRNKHEQEPIVLQQGMAQCRQCGETYPQEADHKSVCRLSPVCPDCNKSFSQWRVMNKHRRIVHMGIKICCPNCGKNYHDSQSLKKHIDAVHLKIKRLCPLCGASVTALAVHMNSVHTGAKNFACQDCGKKFKSNYDLNRHRDTVHLGNKPVCPFCGKHLANIRQHIRVVHKQIRFPCSVCKKQMTTKAELRKHFSKAHYNMDPGIDAPNNQDQTHTVHHHPQPPQQQHQILQEQTKELSEEQLLAQYFRGQQFQIQGNKPEEVTHLLSKNDVLDENHLVVIKPELEQLMAVRTQHPNNKLDAVTVDSLRPQTNLSKADLDIDLLPGRPQPSLDHLLSQRGPNHIDQLLGRTSYPVHMVPVTHQPNTQPLWNGIHPTHQEHDSSEDDYDSGNDEPSDYFPLERRASTSHTPASQQEGAEPDQEDRAVIDLPDYIPNIDLDGANSNMEDVGIRHLEFPRRVSHSVHVETLNERLQLLSTNNRFDVAPAGLVEALPPEVVLVIFGHLDDISLYAVGNVCRRWRQLLRSQSSPHQWHMYTRRRWPLYQPLSTVTDWFTIFSTLIDSSFCRSCIYQMSEVIPNDMDSPPMREKRLGHDLRGLAQDAPEGIEAQPLDSCYYHWQASITGPVGSPYEGGVFYLYLKVPFTYPFDPPEVRFLTKIFHPNVSRHGDVGIDSIQQANWVSGLTIPKVLISIQSLLTDPFCDVCMEPEVADLYKKDKHTFDAVARSWTWKYAMHDVLMPKTRA